jgi:hypothetical protein
VTDAELDALVAPFVAQGWPLDKARTAVAVAWERLRPSIDELPLWMESVTREAPITHARLLLHLIDTTVLLGSVEGCFYLTRVGLIASERLRAAVPPDDERKQ